MIDSLVNRPRAGHPAQDPLHARDPVHLQGPDQRASGRRRPGTPAQLFRVESAARPARPLLRWRTGDGLDHRHGRNPYINASIMQLMQGDPQPRRAGARGGIRAERLNQYTRLLTVPMAFAQGYGLQRPAGGQRRDPQNLFFSFETLPLPQLDGRHHPADVAGELISERGLGNGISFIIFAGIVGQSYTRRRDHRAGWPAADHPVHHHRDHRHRRRGLHQRGPAPDPVQYASRVRGRRMYQARPSTCR